MSPRLLSGAARLAGSSLLRLQTDERLVALARSGHAPAFAAIVERYRDELLRYAERLVGPSRAEDVLQQAFLNAHLAMPSVADHLKLRAWLYRITHNVALNVLRAARPQAALDDTLVGPAALHADLEVRERLRGALDAIARLPEPQRAALTLQAIEGRSHEEVAAALGLTAGAARQNVHRARATVRAAVSAITPYGLLERFAMAGSSSSVSAADLAAGGAGAAGALTKAAAAVLAAGAIAGGATQFPPSHHHSARGTQASEAQAATRTPTGAARDDSASRAADHPAAFDDHGRTRGRDRHGNDDVADDHGSRHRGEQETGDDRSGRSGSDDFGGSGSGSGDDRSGSSGPGPGDDRTSGGDSVSGEPLSSGDDRLSGHSGSDGGMSLSGGSGPSGAAPLPVIDGSGTSGSGTSGSDTSGSGTSGSDGGSGSGSSGSDDLSSGSGSGGLDD